MHFLTRNYINALLQLWELNYHITSTWILLDYYYSITTFNGWKPPANALASDWPSCPGLLANAEVTSSATIHSLSVFTVGSLQLLAIVRPRRAATETWRPCPARRRPSCGWGTACRGRVASGRPSTAGDGITAPSSTESVNSSHIIPEPRTTQHLFVAARRADATWRRSCGPRTGRPRGGLKVLTTP